MAGLRFLIWDLISVVLFEDRVSVVIISRYDQYEIRLSKRLFESFIECKPTCGGHVSRE